MGQRVGGLFTVWGGVQLYPPCRGPCSTPPAGAPALPPLQGVVGSWLKGGQGVEVMGYDV